MSLSSFLKLPEVVSKIKPFRTPPPRKIPAQLRVEPRSKRYMTVGTAFDYMLRFELQRRAPHAIARSWIVEHAAESIWDGSSFAHLWRDERGAVRFVTGDDPEMGGKWGGESLAKETAATIQSVIDKAKSAVAAFRKSSSPTMLDLVDLAGHAIRLAKLDDMPRGHRLDPSFEEAAEEDIQDLIDMLAIVPFESLLHEKILILNPIFGEASVLVGGADADLISGDLLIDFKTTKRSVMEAEDLDQLLGYFFLARRHRLTNGSFPETKRVALYFCRHGHLWILDTKSWTDMPEFAQVEEWFFARAKEVFNPVA